MEYQPVITSLVVTLDDVVVTMVFAATKDIDVPFVLVNCCLKTSTGETHGSADTPFAN